MLEVGNDQNLFENEIKPIKADRQNRALNLILDLIFFQLMYGFLNILIEILAEITMESSDNWDFYMKKLVCYYLYYVIMEYFFKGRTFGKFCTKTKVVMLNGDDLSLGAALWRNLIRLIPFEFISAFMGEECNPIHDKWSQTEVIDLTIS